MTAGQSAHDVARRKREQAERLQRSAALWEQGAEGEVAVARALEAMPEGWVVLHDLAWPGRQRANLDHVVVGPGGVFVVDAKNWSGRVEVRNQVLMQDGRKRDSTVSSAKAAAMAVQELVAPHPCVGVLCFVRDEPLAAAPWDVVVCSTTNLVATLTSHPQLLSADDVRAAVDAIRLGTVRQTALPTAPRMSTPRSAKRGRPLLALVGALALLAAITSGGYQKAATWVGEQIADVMAPDAPAEPAKKPTEKKGDNRVKKEKREGRESS